MRTLCPLAHLCCWRGEEGYPNLGIGVSLQSCNAVIGPLLDVFGHLLCPPNDLAGASRMVLWSARPRRGRATDLYASGMDL